jgi:4-amino-4-deoxy-L-arabinose transferase-like glycosyltransferase
LWCYAGEETVLVPAGVGVLFTLAIVGLAASAAWSVQRQATGLLAGAALLGTPYFIRHAAYQYADTPLAYYILGAIVLLYLAGRRQRNRRGLLALCGLMTGLAAWTKNEGLIFLGAVLIAHGAAATWKRGWRTAARESAWLGLGLLPVLALLGYYKLGLAPANDLAAAQDWRRAAAKLADPARHWVITKHLGQAVVRYGNGLVFILAGYAALVGWTRQRATRAGLGEVWIIAGLMLAGYWVVYAVTPQDLEWHLETSANRLLLQLLPAVVLAFFLWAAGPEELLAPATE